METMRVWLIPKINCKKIFYVPVNNVEDAKIIISVLNAYDMFQVQNEIKPDFSQTCGLEIWNDDKKSWEDWEYESEDGKEYYDSVALYCFEKSDRAEELEEFRKKLFGQVAIDLRA